MPKKKIDTKKRKKKTYSVKALQEKWKQERFDVKKYYDKANTILAIVSAVLLIALGLFAFIGSLVSYTPIEIDEAISESIEFERLLVRYRGLRNTRRTEIIVSTDQREITLPRIYPNSVEKALSALPKGSILDVKFDTSGTIVEIKSSGKEILNFDVAQQKLLLRTVSFCVCGALLLIGAILCIVYACIKIFKERIFEPSKNVYKR
jgi:hypothetical protein